MSFREVVGHRRLVQLLERSIAQESLPPSLIFAGPKGVGKRLVATAIAQTLNCVGVRQVSDPNEKSVPTGVRHVSDPDCSSCRRIARGVHPDVLIVEPGESGSIKIDQIRDCIERAAYRPFEGRRRVVIVDDADALVPAAQNALLKILEEPPSSSTFILITSRPDMLLPTVRSRCPRLRFRELDNADVITILVRLGRAEADARALAASAGGSVGRALEASAGDLVEAREIAMSVLAQAGATDDPRRRLEAAKELVIRGTASADRDELAIELRAMASLVRDIELLSADGAPGSLANSDARAGLERLSYRGARGVRAYQAIDRALEAIDGNAGVKTVADWIVLQL